HDIGWLPLGSSTAIVAGVATVASFSPAWRATLLSPMVAIRNEPGSIRQVAHRHIRRSMHQLSHAFSSADESPLVSDGTLLAEFIAAARSADSFTEALSVALTTLCSRLRVESALLLEKRSQQEYKCAAAAPNLASPHCSLPADGFLVNRLRAYPFPLAF